MGAVRHFYDKLIQLPLEEKAPELLSHYLITFSTLERVNNSCYIRAEKGRFILQDVIATLQQKPEMLDVFCKLLQDWQVAEKLAQPIKGVICTFKHVVCRIVVVFCACMHALIIVKCSEVCALDMHMQEYAETAACICCTISMDTLLSFIWCKPNG